MTRSYTKSKRAENEADTRQRIVAAAMALHEEIGPSATTISLIAQRAGVQRHTVYAHFADEFSLLMACSGTHLEAHPLPSVDQWASLNDPATRLLAALTALYGWFEENETMTASVLRDVDTNPTLQQVMGQRLGLPLAAIHESLSGGLQERARAALTLALNFHTWRTLRRDASMTGKDAIALMVETVLAANSRK